MIQLATLPVLFPVAPNAPAAAAEQLALNGCATIPQVFSIQEVTQLLQIIDKAEATSHNFRRTQDLFAIRNLLGEIPELQRALFTPKLRQLLDTLFPNTTPCLTKAIYFDKPAQSNWLVAWHQDLMHNVNQRLDFLGFSPWSTKSDNVSVQPPREILESICTLRLHLDDCNATNGALKVVPRSHQCGAIPAANLPAYTLNAITCPVPAGGVMLMKPLTLHASNRSTSARPRRVIHLEFSAAELPSGLHWRERLPIL
ncbi:phytanoyl-CoA dioxygenase family protein [Hymenobacter aerilatus]|uniref:Phytanoyl-CoA dioxygenase family protein n=1 Tax=Hymenobacter aerilatus TaxID=2932251 RepID=A0A8T9SX42_9BACT|nr:phytanoyl-CoA dioxygenase family protein [Hymenobacter aerilatus]UOR06405.1 phytanoyl-CoA dioxygenase family protein [Hymenobacter aerilatus]